MSRRLPHDWLDEPLPDNVWMGRGAWVHSSFAFLHCRSRRPTAVAVGAHSGVYIGTMFELGPEGEVAIGEYTTVVAAIFATDGRIEVGDRTFLAHDVVISDDGFRRPRDAGTSTTKPRGRGATIGSDVWIGMRSIIVGPVTIGDGAVIGAGTLITEDVPGFAVVAGSPSRIIRRLAPETRAGRTSTS